MLSEKSLLLRGYAAFMLVFIAAWWPLSHWFYADWYHVFLGFQATDDAMISALVKVIGTMGLFPVLLLAYIIKSPGQARPYILIFLAWSVGMAATYLHLIWGGVFPQGEYINVALLVGNFAVMGWLMPSPSVQNG